MCDYASYQPCPKSAGGAEALQKKRDEKKSPGIEFQEEYLR